MTCNPKENPEIQKWIGQHEECLGNMGELHEWIFTELKTQGAGPIQGLISGYDGPIPHEEYFHEVCNMIAGAAAIEAKNYDPLVDLVRGLTGIEDKTKKWHETNYEVTVRCLANHASQTTHFLYRLLDAKILDPYWIYKHLSVNGVEKPENVVLAIYFGGDIWAQENLKRKFFLMWQHLWFSPDKQGKFLVTEIYKDVKPRCDEMKWDEFNEKRRAGTSGNEILEAIREDNFDKLKEAVGETPFEEVEIPYSIFDAYLHFEAVWEVNNERVGLTRPIKLMDAIGLLGATKCFTSVLQNVAGKGKALLDEAKVSIVAGGGPYGFISQLDDNEISLKGTLSYAVRSHYNDAISFILRDAKEPDAVSREAIEKASAYGNFPALMQLYDENKESGFKYNETPGFLHLACVGNNLQFFKYLLSQVPGEINVYEGTEKTRSTFLHWAGRYQSKAILKYWVEAFGVIGFDALNSNGLNPHHLLAACGIPDKKYARDTVGQKKHPLYGQICRKLDEEYIK